MRRMRKVCTPAGIAIFMCSLIVCTLAWAAAPVQIPWMYEVDGMNAPEEAYFVEEACVYWQTWLPRLPFNDPEAYYEIRGWYPNSRFYSLQTYWYSLAVDHLFDFEIDPDSGGSINPSRDGVPYPRKTFPPEDLVGSDTDLLRYTVRLIPVMTKDEIPEVRPPNTLYMILTSYQDEEGVWHYFYQVICRVYWNEMAGDAYLPMLSRDPDDPYYVTEEFEAEYGLDHFINNPRDWEKRGQVLLPKIYLITTNSPITGPPGEELEGPLFRTGTPPDLGASPNTPEYAWWGIGLPYAAYANSATSYILADLDESYGDVFVVRFKAPTFPNTNQGDIIDPTVQQVRYWSLCTHYPGTMTTHECMGDHELEIDDDGYVTAVFSPDDKKPANAGTNWMGFGIKITEDPDTGEPIEERMSGTRVYLRHMLPSQDTLPESPYFYAQDCRAAYPPDTQEYEDCLFDACSIADYAQKYYPRTRFYAQSEYEACIGSCTIGVLDLDLFAAKFGKAADPGAPGDGDCDEDVDGLDLQVLSRYQEHNCSSE